MDRTAPSAGRLDQPVPGGEADRSAGQEVDQRFGAGILHGALVLDTVPAGPSAELFAPVVDFLDATGRRCRRPSSTRHGECLRAAVRGGVILKYSRSGNA